MTTARFTITHAGPQVSVQDAGRPGLMRFGVPESGPMDALAFQTANLALGNVVGQAAIEVSLGGLSLQCREGAVSFAVAGGSFLVALNGQRLGSWAIAIVRSGDTITIRPGRWGRWCYLAFAGALCSTRWLGSASTYSPSGLGGGALTTGTDLLVDSPEIRARQVGAMAIPISARPRRFVRVVLGPQERFFSPATVQTLLTQPFTLTDASDRMGVRLAGPSLRPDAALDMPSEAVQRGSLQVAGDGVATVLLADHQTTGGYPKIATLLSDDLDGFAQLRSRQSVHFVAVSHSMAIASHRTRQQARRRYLGGFPRLASTLS